MPQSPSSTDRGTEVARGQRCCCCDCVGRILLLAGEYVCTVCWATLPLANIGGVR